MLPPLANVFTLGARDLTRLRAFYDRLGWPVVFEDQEFVAYGLRGAVVCLFPVDKLAADGRTDPEPSRAGMRFSIGILVDSSAEVDALAEQVRQAGGRRNIEPVNDEFLRAR